MDYREAFTFVRDDENWIQKIAWGVLMVILNSFILPVFVLQGWNLAITRNVMNGAEKPLASWDDWQTFLGDGFKLTIAQLAYALPLILVAMFTFIPAAGLGASDSSAAQGVGALFGLTGGLLMFGLGLLLAFLTPAIIIQYARTGELGACFRFGDVFKIARENVGSILTMFIILIAAFFALAAVGGILTLLCVGIVLLIVGPVWLGATQAHMTGQIGRQYMAGKEKDAYAL